MKRRIKKCMSAAARRPAHYRPLIEVLEDRMLLSAGVPLSIVPSAASQTLFGSDLSRKVIDPGSPTRLFEFALDGQAAQDAVTFNLAPGSQNSTTDAGLGLYDSDGNQLAAADNNEGGQPGTEHLS